MIPGVLMYRALVALINMHGVVGEVTVAVSNGINASLIILCIALGVAVPNIFARRYIAKDRQRFLKEELQKRRERESSLSGKSGMFDIKGAVSIAEAALFRLCLFPYAAETGCCERTGAFTATIRLAASSLLLSPFRAVWRCVPDGCRPAE